MQAEVVAPPPGSSSSSEEDDEFHNGDSSGMDDEGVSGLPGSRYGGYGRCFK